MARSKPRSKSRRNQVKPVTSQSLVAQVPPTPAVEPIADSVVEVAIETVTQTAEAEFASSSKIAEDCFAKLAAITAALSEQASQHTSQLDELRSRNDEFVQRALRCEAAEVRLIIAVQSDQARKRKLREILGRLKKLRERTLEQRQRLSAKLRRRLANAHAASSQHEHDCQTVEATKAIESLQADLEFARNECDELRWQLNDMASKLAATEVRRADTSGKVSQETMTWDQRKAMMLAKLSEDDDGGSPIPDLDSRSRESNLQVLLERSEQEVRRKEAEIAELRNLLQEQCNASNGVVVGAAAFAQMFDSDEIIREEREKLREIQQQWEDKLRQAEIEMSLERAKLARERLEVEQQSVELQERLREIEQLGPDRGGESKRKPVRRWLAQLGLGEDAS